MPFDPLNASDLAALHGNSPLAHLARASLHALDFSKSAIIREQILYLLEQATRSACRLLTSEIARFHESPHYLDAAETISDICANIQKHDYRCSPDRYWSVVDCLPSEEFARYSERILKSLTMYSASPAYVNYESNVRESSLHHQAD